ncbi:MAG: DMT family transporter [Pegethrix bostrychoides GSE-TBD4-15B]|jgi:drug/metabolite transporter (DMT)-like permease|uniref:DMT family transporter n=1 Tax=Pegethrix bostrychoides GSE-TBD4-15B TaxID=2839662 RepID=A0A951P992_9CYAN|nr:DMT family transporter [Pegethrix bostrychoides GSE-TBD4-15B]
MKSRTHLRSLLLLLLTTLIWGSTFPLLKDMVTTLPPALLIGSRFLVAALAFLPCCALPNLPPLTLGLLRDGSRLGLVAFISFLAQVVGLETVSANRAAFITGLNVVMVPLLGWLLGRGISLKVFAAALLAFGGIAVMSGQTGTLGSGDLWILVCAFSYAVYILLTEAVTARHSPIQLTAVQLITIALLGIAWTLWTLPLDNLATLVVQQLRPHWVALVYLGLIATALTTWMQVTAQRHLSATEAAILYSLEPVFAALFSFWWLAERLSLREGMGAMLVLVAMIWSQLGNSAAEPAKPAG